MIGVGSLGIFYWFCDFKLFCFFEVRFFVYIMGEITFFV